MEQVSKSKAPFARLLKWFSVTGLIHTLISVAVFVLSALNVANQTHYYDYYIGILSAITLFNSLIWLICAILLMLVAKKLNNPKSVKSTRKILFLSILFVLTPDILLVILYWLPMLKGTLLINIIGFASPVLVFIGWFIGKRLGKKIIKNKKEQ